MGNPEIKKDIPVEEVRRCALQMYKEIKWAIGGDHAMECAADILRSWMQSYAEEAASFKEAFPDEDPQLCMLATKYIVEHKEEIVKASADSIDSMTDIDVEQALQFGFRDKVQKTFRGTD